MNIQTVGINLLKYDEENARKHDPQNIETIKKSLERFGQQKPIVVNTDNVVVAGNGTLEACKQLGWKKIDIIKTELAGLEAKAYAVADNRTSELAVWDDETLASVLEELRDSDTADVLSTGFTEEDIERLIGGWKFNDTLRDADDYNEDEHETYTVKIKSISHADKDDVVKTINVILIGKGYEYKAEAF